MDSSPSNAAERSASRQVDLTLPKAAFRLKLERIKGKQLEKSRWATYDPYSARLVWEDNGEPLIDGAKPSEDGFFNFLPVSPETPTTKSKSLKLIKIQVGFGCNYSCGYCSQKAFRPTTNIGSEKEAQAFLEKMSTWFDGGEHGTGQGTRVDFLGGETLLYWKLVRTLARGMKERYPNLRFSLYTNGSVVVDELVDEAIKLDLLVMLSHDGLDQKTNRGQDPFDKPQSRDFLRNLAARLIPKNLFLVQMTLGKSNFSLADNRDHLAGLFALPVHNLPLAFDIVHAFEESAKTLVPVGDDEVTKFQARALAEFRKLTWTQALAFAIFRMDLVGLLDPLVGRTSMADAHQRCEMDKPTSLAVDLKGNVLTCQNTTAQGGHKIGHLDQFEKVRLTTSLHWSNRKNCRNCPVVSMCKGACMYTKDEEFQKTCDSMFGYYLAVLTYALENIIGWKLTEIHGQDIRARGVDKIQIA